MNSPYETSPTAMNRMAAVLNGVHIQVLTRTRTPVLGPRPAPGRACRPVRAPADRSRAIRAGRSRRVVPALRRTAFLRSRAVHRSRIAARPQAARKPRRSNAPVR